MYRAPTWKTGTAVASINAPVSFVPNTSPAQYTHTDFQVMVTKYPLLITEIQYVTSMQDLRHIQQAVIKVRSITVILVGEYKTD